MKKLLLVCVSGAFLAPAAMAADPYETWLTEQKQRGKQIELIRVANEKAIVATEESDADVASILAEVEALEAEPSEEESPPASH